jgi:hypothetical protein
MTPVPVLVKIAFVLDCTGSMEPWIQEAKTKLRTILAETRRLHPAAEFEVALVAYRDYDDEGRAQVVDFTSADAVLQVLRPIHAEGGDDEAEDVAGALDHVSRLTWGPSDVRLLFHITDAPAHGLAYHAPTVSDRFPEGDPERRNLRFILSSLAGMDIDYTFVRITSSTDKMIDVFHEAYRTRGKMLRVIDLHPQTYDGRYGRVREGNMAEVLSPALTRVVTQAVTRYTSSQDT